MRIFFCFFLFFFFLAKLGFGSIEMDFIIDPSYVIGHMLHWKEGKRFSSKKNRKDILAFQREVWWKSRGELPPLPYLDTPQFYDNDPLKEFMEWAQSLVTFKKILDEMKEYKYDLEKKWQSDYAITSRYIEEVTGLSLTGKYVVYLTHPSQLNGKYLGNHKIAWGSSGTFGHYDVIYLWHEILHSILPRGKISHCVIQLIADNGLRKHLNVSEKKTPLIGYPSLMPLMEKLTPKWEEYLKKNPKKDIFSFLEEMESSLDSKDEIKLESIKQNTDR